MSKANLFTSFIYAFKGLALALKERNFLIHLFSALVAVSLGFYCNISTTEWIAICICIGGVTGLELLNTAVEKTVDLVHPLHHPKAGNIKDLAAAAVLVFALASAIVGLLIFIPYFVN